MTNKIKITLNGQSFEVPMDLNVLQGFVRMVPGTMPQARMNRALPIQISQEQSAQLRTVHRRLEDEFFQKIREDMEVYRMFGMFGREERISRAIIALHNRVRRLENMCGIKGSAVIKQTQPAQVQPAQVQPAQVQPVEGMQIDPKFVETLMKNLVSNLVQSEQPIGQQNVGQPESLKKQKEKVEKVVKPKKVVKTKPSVVTKKQIVVKGTKKVKSPFNVKKKS